MAATWRRPMACDQGSRTRANAKLRLCLRCMRHLPPFPTSTPCLSCLDETGRNGPSCARGQRASLLAAAPIQDTPEGRRITQTESRDSSAARSDNRQVRSRPSSGPCAAGRRGLATCRGAAATAAGPGDGAPPSRAGCTGHTGQRRERPALARAAPADRPAAAAEPNP